MAIIQASMGSSILRPAHSTVTIPQDGMPANQTSSYKFDPKLSQASHFDIINHGITLISMVLLRTAISEAQTGGMNMLCVAKVPGEPPFLVRIMLPVRRWKDFVQSTHYELFKVVQCFVGHLLFQTAKTLHQAGCLPASHEPFSPPPRPARNISRQERRASIRAERKLLRRPTLTSHDCCSSTGLDKNSFTAWISVGPRFVKDTFASFIDAFVSAFSTGPLIYQAAAADKRDRGNTYRSTPYNRPGKSDRSASGSNGSHNNHDLNDQDDNGYDDGASSRYPYGTGSPLGGDVTFSCPVGNRSKKGELNNPCRIVVLNSHEDVIRHCQSEHYGCPICVRKEGVEVKKAYFGTVKDLKNHIIRMHFHHLRCPINNCGALQSLKNGFKRHAQKGNDHGNNRLSDSEFETAWSTMTETFRQQHPLVSGLVESINRVSPKPAREALNTLERLLFPDGVKVYDSIDGTNTLKGLSTDSTSIISGESRSNITSNGGPLQINLDSAPMDYGRGQPSQDFGLDPEFFLHFTANHYHDHQPTMTPDGAGFMPPPQRTVASQNNPWDDSLNVNWASPTFSQLNSNIPSMPTVANGGITAPSHDEQSAFNAVSPQQNRYQPPSEPFMGLEPRSHASFHSSRPGLTQTRHQSVPIQAPQENNGWSNNESSPFRMDRSPSSQRPTAHHASTSPAVLEDHSLMPAPTTLAPSQIPATQVTPPSNHHLQSTTGTGDMEEFLYHWGSITPLLQRADTATRRAMWDEITNTLSANPPPETAHSDTTYGGSSQTPSETVRSEYSRRRQAPTLQPQQQQQQQQAAVGLTGAAFSTGTTFEDSPQDSFVEGYQYYPQ